MYSKNSLKDINSQVGEKIRQLRYKARYNHKTVSEGVGISISTLSKMENGLSDISIRKLLDIAEFHKAKLTDVLPDNLLPNDIGLKKQLEEAKDLIIDLQAQLLKKEV